MLSLSQIRAEPSSSKTTKLPSIRNLKSTAKKRIMKMSNRTNLLERQYLQKNKGAGNSKKMMMNQKLQDQFEDSDSDYSDSTRDGSSPADSQDSSKDTFSFLLREDCHPDMPEFLDPTSPAYQRLILKIENGTCLDAKTIA